MADQELKACPFCDSNNVAVIHNTRPQHQFDWDFAVVCGECDAKGSPEQQRSDAIAAWNTRAEPASVPTVQAGDECATIWREITEPVINVISQMDEREFWLRTKGGKIIMGRYEWRQGGNPDRFIGNEIGDDWALSGYVTHIAPIIRPSFSTAPSQPVAGKPSDEQICEALNKQGMQTHSAGYATNGDETMPIMLKGTCAIISAFRALFTTTANAGKDAELPIDPARDDYFSEQYMKGRP